MPETIDCSGGRVVSARDVETRKVTLKEGSNISYQVCSNPTLALSERSSCSGDTVYHRFTNDKGTEVVTICRRSPPNSQGRMRVLVGATIAYRPSTGATCFFKYKKETPFQESGLLPGPALPHDKTAKDPRRNWETPGFITNMAQGSCVNCHSTYPWIRGPHTTLQGQAPDHVVPMNDYHEKSGNGMKPRIDRELPYYIVARRELERLIVQKLTSPTTGNWTPIVLDQKAFAKGDSRSTCLTCHRLGQGRMLTHWAPSAFGIFPSFSSASIEARMSHRRGVSLPAFGMQTFSRVRSGARARRNGRHVLKRPCSPWRNAD